MATQSAGRAYEEAVSKHLWRFERTLSPDGSEFITQTVNERGPFLGDEEIRTNAALLAGGIIAQTYRGDIVAKSVIKKIIDFFCPGLAPFC